MASVERLLESTSISARDVESGQTLIEYAARHSDLSLLKYCYRRGASLTALTGSGDSVVNIAVAAKAYPLVEFLVLYGKAINQGDGRGVTALHTAVNINDVDGICRLVVWGADVTVKVLAGQTPLMYAAIRGHAQVAELLLELGANLNSLDLKDYTAVAHAEANDHFKLMDRLVLLGGRGHKMANNKIAAPLPRGGLSDADEVTAKGVKLGKVSVNPLYLKKVAPIGRLNKFA